MNSACAYTSTAKVLCILFLLFNFYFSSFAQLVINNGGYVVLNGGASITNMACLVINNSSINAITRITSGHIISEGDYNTVKWNCGTTTGSYVVPFGYSTTAYIPLTFNKTSAGSANMSFATRRTVAADNTPLMGVTNVAAVGNMNSTYGGSATASVIDRWWNITASAAATANITFSYRGEENTMTIGPTGPIDAQHWNGTIWELPVWAGSGTGVTGAGTVGSTTITGANTFSPWILVARSAPLPIELLDFTAVCLSPSGGGAGGGVSVNWSTASETNNAFFTIERSLSHSGGGVGGGWAAVGTVNGAGNSNSILYYQFTDENIEQGTFLYYRLKQTDFDGAFTYSGIIAVSCQDNLIEIINIYPNPASGCFDYIICSTEDREIFVSVTDVSGKVIISKKENITKGLNYKSLDVSTLASACYYLKIETLNGLNKDSKQILVK
ncbi:MAG: T9SS type A sorting domain-containing protein [Syntrophales bacterium]